MITGLSYERQFTSSDLTGKSPVQLGRLQSQKGSPTRSLIPTGASVLESTV